ncbi:hypothetical protein SAMN05192543_11245 [Paraburkholderia megapolitana]|uniref:Uncharacterized protein n=2 Tax=Paraburkholderia megapolitana TaxID=420953 RepID=A0A1I3UTP4_9BURK|nr:hypothetical protein SAMN05192543_11245 [Paraburkholderia megapolitana]
MGATAIAAGLAGLGGIATGLAGMAMDTTEEADLLEFDLDGQRIKAWVWLSVFSEDDEVEVVAEQWGNTWQGYGIRRTSDKIVALHPHCSRGRYAHYRASLRWWMKIFLPFLGLSYLIMGIIAVVKNSMPLENLMFGCLIAGGVTAVIFGFIGIRISRKFMGFVRLAEGIFNGFGWKDVRNIDLPAITKKSKKSDDPGPLGVLYFRY